MSSESKAAIAGLLHQMLQSEQCGKLKGMSTASSDPSCIEISARAGGLSAAPVPQLGSLGALPVAEG